MISDTHGLLRPQALDALRGSDLILHAGDIGGEDVLAALRTIAPTCAVRGNNDRDAWAATLPLTDVVEIGARQIYILHDLADLDLDPAGAGFAAVVSGHSHKPRIEWREGVLYLNPGSAGPRRFTLPIALARLHVTTQGLKPEPIELVV